MLPQSLDSGTYMGWFMTAPDQRVQGRLTVDGKDSSLKVWNNDYLFHNKPSYTITGELRNLSKVSLIGCTLSYGHVDESGSYYIIRIKYVLIGSHYVEYSQERIDSIDFVISDASSLLYTREDHDPVDDRKALEQIIQTKDIDRNISQ